MYTRRSADSLAKLSGAAKVAVTTPPPSAAENVAMVDT